ncbi:MBL fold metallo-hydrolase [Rhodococcus rhodnii]|uniref:Metallo-beta-lactamase domain-containing protein n=2 Tax=Rhodococcus rhodnii TaxID=38312 RepID=R7WWJ3_9NOCA|nr:MBL fold metallo-hydrolase [Rhodococcus rhodnii]EOM78509.1 hypothetical protein Rrhod_0046 [Rhodococcus rhodnii LMG 5362]TXG91303.1 MBL fold metallo-hydrolase [Rhodococcus rhodnii]
MTQQPIVIEDSYSGHVAAGSGAARRTLDDATIVKISVGPMDNNSYLVRCSTTGRALLVDAANDADRILGAIAADDAAVEAIVTTHQHGDHWQALEEVAAATGAPTIAHPLDADALPVAPARRVDDGDAITVGGLTLGVVHLAGHTPGGIALTLTEPTGRVHVFTGDSLFPGGIGRTAGPDEFESLLGDVERKLFDRFGDDTVVYPGHGDDTTFGAERPHLDEWRERDW